MEPQEKIDQAQSIAQSDPQIRNDAGQDRAPPRNRTLAEIFEAFIGKAEDLPPDMAEQHDHYLHGHPKQLR